MPLPANLTRRLPNRFPVGTTYVVEGRAGHEGQLRVSSRYVVLPGGKRINVTLDQGPAASARGRTGRRRRPDRQARDQAKTSAPARKNIFSAAGTTRNQAR